MHALDTLVSFFVVESLHYFNKSVLSISHKIRLYSNTQVKLAYGRKTNVYCQSE